MKKHEPQLIYVVKESQQCLLFAERFLKQELHDPEKDSWVTTEVPARRHLVNKFQKLVMDIFCDDLFLETMLETPEEDIDQDVLDTFKIYQEFLDHFAQYDVIAMVPMNLAGTIGFVLQHKSMSPKTRK